LVLSRVDGIVPRGHRVLITLIPSQPAERAFSIGNGISVIGRFVRSWPRVLRGADAAGLFDSGGRTAKYVTRVAFESGWDHVRDCWVMDVVLGQG
jgi:hypothetical protein